MTILDFATLVRQKWGDEYAQPDDAYEFTGRTFKDTGKNGGIYVISTAVAPSNYGINAGGEGADQEGFTLTGIASELLKTRPIDAGVGAYALTGVDVTFRSGFAIGGDVQAYALTGVDATLRLNYGRFPASIGTYALTGADATLTKALKVAGSMTAEVGSFGVTGVDVITTK